MPSVEQSSKKTRISLKRAAYEGLIATGCILLLMIVLALGLALLLHLLQGNHTYLALLECVTLIFLVLTSGRYLHDRL